MDINADELDLMEALQNAFLQQMRGQNYTGEKPPASQSAWYEMDDVVIAQKHVDEGTDCGICLQKFKLHDDTKRMPCKHLFHDLCLLPWLQKNNTCPLCRFELPTLDADYESLKRASHRRDRDDSQRRGGGSGGSAPSYPSMYS